MNRRRFLRAAALGGTAAGLPAVANAFETDAGPRTRDGGRTPHATTPNGTTGTGTATPTETSTPTPTDAVATPTSAWEPLGRVAVEGATETVLTPDGETAFVAVGEGFATVDCSDPAEPTVLARETDISPPGTDRVVGGAADVKYDAGEALLAGPAGYDPDAFSGVVRYDVTDPAAPELVDAYQTTFPVHNCDFHDGHAYLTGNDGVRNPLVVVDLDAGEAVARWSVLDHDEEWADVDQSLRRLHDVRVHDGRAYLAYWDAGTWILDVSDPASPDHVGHVLAQPLEDLQELSNLPAYRESVEPPGNDHYVATDPAGRLMAVGKESWNSNAGLDGTTPSEDDPGGPSGIDLYDISDPAEPSHLATIEPPVTADPNVNGVWTTAHNFEVGERYLYSAWYQGGVKVHDLADPANPEEVRYFRRSSTTSFWTAQLGVPGETVVATSRRNPADLDAAAEVFTFPDVPRETPTGTATATATGSSPTSTTGGETAAGTTTRSETSAGGTSTGEHSTGGRTAETAETADATAGDGPGFGPLAVLAGLGVGAWRLVGGSENDSNGER